MEFEKSYTRATDPDIEPRNNEVVKVTETVEISSEAAASCLDKVISGKWIATSKRGMWKRVKERAERVTVEKERVERGLGTSDK